MTVNFPSIWEERTKVIVYIMWVTHYFVINDKFRNILSFLFVFTY